MAGNTAFRILSAIHGQISVIHRTPFSGKPPAPKISEQQKYLLALAGSEYKENLPYGLDVWAPKKVLNIEWDALGRVEVRGYRPGVWETELETLALLRVWRVLASQWSRLLAKPPAILLERGPRLQLCRPVQIFRPDLSPKIAQRSVRRTLPTPAQIREGSSCCLPDRRILPQGSREELLLILATQGASCGT